jgi:hypothetical protein
MCVTSSISYQWKQSLLPSAISGSILLEAFSSSFCCSLVLTTHSHAYIHRPIHTLCMRVCVLTTCTYLCIEHTLYGIIQRALNTRCMVSSHMLQAVSKRQYAEQGRCFDMVHEAQLFLLKVPYSLTPCTILFVYHTPCTILLVPYSLYHILNAH